jgi:hypothetical protein
MEVTKACNTKMIEGLIKELLLAFVFMPVVSQEFLMNQNRLTALWHTIG